MKPIIGIVGRPGMILDKYYVEVAEETYKNAILYCGGIPITILPPQMISYDSIKPRKVPLLKKFEKETLNQILNMCDGILMPGGNKSYEYDYYIYEYAKCKNIPIFGICAGMQIMAKSGANTKIIKNIDNKHKININGYSHSIKINPNSKLYDIIGLKDIVVNSYHNYHVNNSGNNLVSAISDDFIIEAIEDNNNDYCIGIQWHPEKNIRSDNNSKILFDSFIDASSKYKVKYK